MNRFVLGSVGNSKWVEVLGGSGAGVGTRTVYGSPGAGQGEGQKGLQEKTFGNLI